MTTFAEISEFRRSDQAAEYAANWIRAQETGNAASEWHMNLLAWTHGNPAHVLGLVLNLLDLSTNDEEISEMVAMGPLEWLVEHCPEDFAILLREAVSNHPGFALATSWKRLHSDHSKWRTLRTN